MQLKSVNLARSVWLFDINELNPSGKSLFPDMLLWFGEKYSFQEFPKSLSDIDKQTRALVFKTGEFQIDHDTVTVNFSLYNDGVVAETWSSTDKTDIFLEDVLKSASGKYGLAFEPELIRKRQYISEITVQLDHSLNDLDPRFMGFCDKLSTVFKRHDLPSFQVYGIGFSPDVSATVYKPPGLTIERKLGVPYSENRYWSRSPFTTAEHLQMLTEFEKLLAH